MRAEAQAHIDQINAATTLLRRFLDWDRALKRLDYKGMIAMEFYPDADPVEALRKALLEAEKDLG